MTAVIMINSAVVWRNKWKERMWRLAKFAEALTDARTDDVRKLSGTIHFLSENRTRFPVCIFVVLAVFVHLVVAVAAAVTDIYCCSPK